MFIPLLAFRAGTSGPKNKAGCGRAQNGSEIFLFVEPFAKGGGVDIISHKRIASLLGEHGIIELKLELQNVRTEASECGVSL